MNTEKKPSQHALEAEGEQSRAGRLTHPKNIASHKADQHVNLRPRSCMLIRVDTCWERGKDDPTQRILQS